MNVKEKTISIKFLQEKAKMPYKPNPDEAIFDVFAAGKPVYDPKKNVMTYTTGVSIEIPKGYIAMLLPVAHSIKYGWALQTGLITPGEEIKYQYKMNKQGRLLEEGDVVGQFVVIPIQNFELIKQQ